MAKFYGVPFFFLLISCCAVMAAASRLSKRQQCDSSELPEICRTILNITVGGTAFFDPEGFLNTYCSSMCAGPLYLYLSNCDSDPLTATKFDFFCSSNANGTKCLPFTVDALTADDSFYYICTNVTIGYADASECRSALSTAYRSAGCCVYSTFATFFGLSAANLYFGQYSDAPLTLCTGGASNDTLSFPPPSSYVPPECEIFSQNVTPSCRHLLLDDIIFALPYSGLLDDACSDECGPQVYRYYSDCDEITGGRNATALDVYCARNNKGERCGELDLLIEFPRLNTSSCADGTCPTECAEELRRAHDAVGCCFLSFLDLMAGIEPTASFLLSLLCDIDNLKSCDGPFLPAGEEPTGAKCTSLRNAIPNECQVVATSESPFLTLYHAAYSNASRFQSMFCESDCAKPVYDYVSGCGSETDAAFIDFLCSKSASGRDCAPIVSDSALDMVIDGVCDNATDRVCSDECKNGIKDFNKLYGCCLFSYSALNRNYTFTEGLWRECELDNSGLCTGGITNEAIGAPGAPEPPTYATTQNGGSRAANVPFISGHLLLIFSSLLLNFIA